MPSFGIHESPGLGPGAQRELGKIRENAFLCLEAQVAGWVFTLWSLPDYPSVLFSSPLCLCRCSLYETERKSCFSINVVPLFTCELDPLGSCVFMAKVNVSLTGSTCSPCPITLENIHLPPFPWKAIAYYNPVRKGEHCIFMRDNR